MFYENLANALSIRERYLSVPWATARDDIGKHIAFLDSGHNGALTSAWAMTLRIMAVSARLTMARPLYTILSLEDLQRGGSANAEVFYDLVMLDIRVPEIAHWYKTRLSSLSGKTVVLITNDATLPVGRLYESAISPRRAMEIVDKETEELAWLCPDAGPGFSRVIKESNVAAIDFEDEPIVLSGPLSQQLLTWAIPDGESWKHEVLDRPQLRYVDARLEGSYGEVFPGSGHDIQVMYIPEIDETHIFKVPHE